jgi:hypothetical protein
VAGIFTEPLLRQTALRSPQLYSELGKAVYSAERSDRIMYRATHPIMSAPRAAFWLEWVRHPLGLPADRTICAKPKGERSIRQSSDRKVDDADYVAHSRVAVIWGIFVARLVSLCWQSPGQRDQLMEIATNPKLFKNVSASVRFLS